MTKKEIVKTISEEIGLTQLKTKEIVQKTFDAIVETLVDEHRIELRNFGVFEVKKRAARKARNPRTGEKVDVPAKYVVTFKPGKEMEARVRQMEEEEAAWLASQSVKPTDADSAPMYNDSHASTPPKDGSNSPLEGESTGGPKPQQEPRNMHQADGKGSQNGEPQVNASTNVGNSTGNSTGQTATSSATVD